MYKYLNLILILALISSCKQDEILNPNLNTIGNKGVFIVNEGNFQFGNSSLSFYNFSNNKIYNNIFSESNNIPLGDVAQSMQIIDSLGFIVVNNSSYIYIVNINNFKYHTKISGFSSPRYILPLGNNKAYVSDLYSNKLSIIDTKLFQIIGNINLNASSEKMILIDNKAYISSWSYNNKVFVVDVNSDLLIDSITVGKQPNSLVVDKNNMLWVLCDGGFYGSNYAQEKAGLYKINTLSNSVEKSLIFQNIENSPIELEINNNKDTLFFINNSVYKMSIHDEQLPILPIISSNSGIFYGLKVDNNSNLYLADVKDFVNNGLVFKYTSNGQLITSFEVGIIPRYFCFN